MDVQGWHLFLKEITVEKDVKMHQARTRHTVKLPAMKPAGLHALSSWSATPRHVEQFAIQRLAARYIRAPLVLLTELPGL